MAEPVANRKRQAAPLILMAAVVFALLVTALAASSDARLVVKQMMFCSGCKEVCSGTYDWKTEPRYCPVVDCFCGVRR